MTEGEPSPAPRWQRTELGAALRRAREGYRRRVASALSAEGFDDQRFPDNRVLRMCSRADEMTISDVGHALGITRQGASKIVADLRKRGYLEVTPSATDGREKILTLTPRAVEYMAARLRAARAIEADLRRQIGAEGFQLLFRVLDLVASHDAETEQPPVEAD